MSDMQPDEADFRAAFEVASRRVQSSARRLDRLRELNAPEYIIVNEMFILLRKVTDFLGFAATGLNREAFFDEGDEDQDNPDPSLN